MVPHLDETRARTERELESMRQALERRQSERHESVCQAETNRLNRSAFDEKLGHAFRRTMRQRAGISCWNGRAA